MFIEHYAPFISTIFCESIKSPFQITLIIIYEGLLQLQFNLKQKAISLVL